MSDVAEPKAVTITERALMCLVESLVGARDRLNRIEVDSLTEAIELTNLQIVIVCDEQPGGIEVPVEYVFGGNPV